MRNAMKHHQKALWFCLGVLLWTMSCAQKTAYEEPRVLKDSTTADGFYESDEVSQVNGTEEDVPLPVVSSGVASETLTEEVLPIEAVDGRLPDWQPVFFDFDQAQLTEVARRALTGYAELLQRDPRIRVLLEGHCDERGTESYNQALGERRAESVRRFLVNLGVSPQQLMTISYGEVRPLMTGSSEDAWRLNRRVEFRLQKTGP